MSFIHSLNTHLWNSCCVPGTVRGTEEDSVL